MAKESALFENGTHSGRVGFETFYTISGTDAYVDGEVARIERDYPPQGYGTHVIHRCKDSFGCTIVRMKRSNSCN